MTSSWLMDVFNRILKRQYSNYIGLVRFPTPVVVGIRIDNRRFFTGTDELYGSRQTGCACGTDSP